MPVYSMMDAHPITLDPAAPGSDYAHTFVTDWGTAGNELGADETINDSEWVIVPALSMLSESNTTTTTTISVTGFVSDRVYRFRNQITTTSGLTKEPISFYVPGGFRSPVAKAPKDVGEDSIKGYLFKWGRVLGTSGTIDSVSITVSPSGLTIVGKLIDGQNVYVWFLGGVVSQLYTVTCKITQTGVGTIDPAIILIRGVAK